jgi:hypothetical protein
MKKALSEIGFALLIGMIVYGVVFTVGAISALSAMVFRHGWKVAELFIGRILP